MSRKLEDLSGQIFGRLRVVQYSGSNERGRRWLCRCIEGNLVIAGTSNLKSGTLENLQF